MTHRPYNEAFRTANDSKRFSFHLIQATSSSETSWEFTRIASWHQLCKKHRRNGDVENSSCALLGPSCLPFDLCCSTLPFHRSIQSPSRSTSQLMRGRGCPTLKRRSLKLQAVHNERFDLPSDMRNWFVNEESFKTLTDARFRDTVTDSGTNAPCFPSPCSPKVQPALLCPVPQHNASFC